MSLDSPRPYTTPMAFRRAVTDRLRAIAEPHGPWPLADLQRQFAYDRLLSRLYLLDDGWVVKGATALLARRIAVRHTVDLDVYRAAERQQAERDLRSALALDAGDWFIFEAGRGTPVADGTTGVRIPIVARIGPTPWANFHVDVVADGVRMTGAPDEVSTLTGIEIPGLVQPRYLAYPITDHIADKTCATFERHGPEQRPSTRFKDLVDLQTLIAEAHVDADDQRRALSSEAGRRHLELPVHFDVPERRTWVAGYAAEARRARTPVARTLDEALALVRPYLDPILDGTGTGAWHPEDGVWKPALP
ncbi:hypothetical protein GCM10010193_37820 [Kitasatospora atroaurantiaca]|uniref:Nucleotidyltransferase AbiEii toxin of type IV toxin-antitoxin system n=2 Tax=Kitasatospora atroaurantiaca TaxID=285545 RepID=A0A561EUJ3_9ACTN|nr:nucleotidyltransferase AbiEii toxin of type IV toxin-antitoxin system [Kitasatospora atroaurantiaca]